MSQCHRVEGGAADEAAVFSVGLDFLHAQETKYIKHRLKGKERKKHTRSPSNCTQ